MNAIETHIGKSFIVNVNLNKIAYLLPSHTKETCCLFPRRVFYQAHMKLFLQHPFVSLGI